MRRRTARVFAAVCISAGCGAPMKLASRDLFADLTYSDSDAGTPKSIIAFQLFASLEEEGVTAYRDPHAAAQCYAALTPAYLKTVGESAGAAPPPGIDSAVETGCIATTTMESLKTFPACAAALQSDPKLLAYSITRMAATTEAFARTAMIEPANYDHAFVDATVALGRVAKILAATPAGASAQSDAPALALSGGSANGAFQAGFLFEILAARERALAELSGAEQTAADHGSHFSALVGTSVGALIAQLLDVYYAEPGAGGPALASAIQACANYTPAAQLDWSDQATSTCFGHVDPKTKALEWPTKTFPGLESMKLDSNRALQKCALMNLYRYFSDIEDQQLMCVEPGPVTNVMGILDEARPGLVRFDTMSRDIIDAVLANFSGVALQNDVSRVVVSVDNQQNQTLGLDERTCSALPSVPPKPGFAATPGSREYCLGSGAMASMMLPFFARPVRHVYSGYADTGECGAWLDGGLRSGFPALRALRMTRPTLLLASVDDAVKNRRTPVAPLRVLAVDTGRLDGQAAGRLDTIADVALNAIGQLASQNDVYEAVMAQDEATLRDRSITAIGNCPITSGDAGAEAGLMHDFSPKQPYALPNLSPDDSLVEPIFVPSDIPDAIVAAAEYSFDRYVMRGLFMWGRIVAMNRVLGILPSGRIVPADHRLLAQLAWPPTLAQKAAAWVQADQAATTSPSDTVLHPWARAFTLTTECGDFHHERLADGNARVVQKVPDCGEVTDTSGKTPEYFVCPNGASEPKEAP